MEEEMVEKCGICLSDCGEKVIRGKIDSCDHKFCFVCIMEWSKLESRCPICKQRFQSIYRGIVPGVFSKQRTVIVPLRNQNKESSADSYSEIICTECNTSNDDELLLLCDLCDSGSHTYCVGLGETVPKGDWYCADCAILKKEHTKLGVEEDDPCVPENSCKEPLSVHDIVRDRNIIVTSSTQKNSVVTSRVQREYRKHAEPYSQPSARTLSHHRFVGEHVRRLHGNWDGIQDASISSTTNFNSNPVQSSTAENNTVSAQPSTAENSIVCGASNKDVKKAWEMMDAARKIIKKNPNTLPNHTNSVALKCPGPCKINDAKNLTKLNSTPVIHKREFFSHHSMLLGSGMHRLKFPSSEMQKSNDPITNEGFQIQEHQNPTLKSHSHSVMSGSKMKGSDSQSSEMQKFNDHATKKRLQNQREPLDINFGKRRKLYSEYDFSSKGTAQMCQISNKKPLRRLKHLPSHSTPLINRSSGCPILSTVEEKHVECFEHEGGNSEKLGIDNNTDGSSTEDINNVKSEIQSLVKRTMRPLFVDKRIGTEKFKKIARAATHSIMAACGMEHSKSVAVTFPRLICKHVSHWQPLNIMSSSCTECLSSFVKNVVSAILEKTQD